MDSSKADVGKNKPRFMAYLMDPVRKRKRQNFFGCQRNVGIKELFLITGVKKKLIVLNVFNSYLETAS